MEEDRMTAVARLWKEHRSAVFPHRLRSTDIAGVEMVMLDADIAGCVSSWLSTGGNLDDRRRAILAIRERQLIQVLPELSGPEAVYYRRLLDMTRLMLS